MLDNLLTLTGGYLTKYEDIFVWASERWVFRADLFRDETVFVWYEGSKPWGDEFI